MEDSQAFLRVTLTVFSILDVVFSAIFIIVLAVYSSNCRVEDEYAINYNVTLEQMEFFYDALRECNIREENDVPSSKAICSSLGDRVLPCAGMSAMLNFLLGIFIFIITRDQNFLLDYGRSKKAVPLSLAVIPLFILISMCLAAIGIAEFAKPKFCWLNYSISQQYNSHLQLAMTILVSLLLAFYKPLELGVFYRYGCYLLNAVDGNALDDSDSAKDQIIYLDAQLLSVPKSSS